MKIGIIGDFTGAMAISKALASHDYDVVIIDSIDAVDATSTDILICDDESIAFCGHPLGNVGIEIKEYRVDVPYRDNSFRGGSIGKGGKIKYRRG